MSNQSVVPAASRRAALRSILAAGAVAVAPSAFAGLASADAELIALEGELLDAWGRENQVFATAPNTAAGDAARDAACEVTAAIIDKIEAATARSLAGLRVKVLALHWTAAGEFLSEEELADTSTDNRLIDTIVRDVLAMPPKFEGVPNQPVAAAHRLIAEAESDPVLVAIAKWERVREQMNEAGKVHTAAENAVRLRGPASRRVEFEGASFANLEDLDSHFKSARTRKDVLEIVRKLKAGLPAAGDLAKREAAYKTARKELRRILLAEQRARREARFAQAEAAWNEAVSDEEQCQRSVLTQAPTTSAGARELLRFAANRDDCPEEIAAAIRNAIVAF